MRTSTPGSVSPTPCELQTPHKLVETSPQTASEEEPAPCEPTGDDKVWTFLHWCTVNVLRDLAKKIIPQYNSWLQKNDDGKIWKTAPVTSKRGETGTPRFTLSEFARLVYLLTHEPRLRKALLRSEQPLDRQRLDRREKWDSFWADVVAPVFNDLHVRPLFHLRGRLKDVDPADAPVTARAGPDLRRAWLRAAKALATQAKGAAECVFIVAAGELPKLLTCSNGVPGTRIYVVIQGDEVLSQFAKLQQLRFFCVSTSPWE
eukprot:IDg19147t1